MSDDLHNALLDRLVDGELTADEYRQALISLEGEPDGWRRCALAFLEAQGWTAELHHARRDWEIVETPTKSAAPAKLGLSSGGSRRIVGLLLTTAASFALAFTLGIVYRDHLALSRSPVTGKTSLPDRTHATAGGSSGGAVSSGEQPLPEPTPTVGEPRPSGQYVFTVHDGGGEREMQLPIYDGRQLDEREFADWLAQDEQAGGERLVDALRRAGHDVRARRSLAPIDLRNGQQALAPVLEVDITPAARVYQ